MRRPSTTNLRETFVHPESAQLNVRVICADSLWYVKYVYISNLPELTECAHMGEMENSAGHRAQSLPHHHQQLTNERHTSQCVPAGCFYGQTARWCGVTHMQSISVNIWGP